MTVFSVSFGVKNVIEIGCRASLRQKCQKCGTMMYPFKQVSCSSIRDGIVRGVIYLFLFISDDFMCNSDLSKNQMV